MLKQMGKFTKSYGRYVFFALLVIVCVSFALTPGMLECEAEKKASAVAGTVFGEKVPRAEFEDLKNRWTHSRELLLTTPRTYYAISLAFDPSDWIAQATFMGRLRGRAPSEKDLTSFTWRCLVFLHDATKTFGIRVSDAEVGELAEDIAANVIGKPFDRDKWLAYWEHQSISVEEFEKTVRECLILDRYFHLVLDGGTTTEEKVFEKYLEESEKRRARSVKFEAKDFESQVRLVRTRDSVRPAAGKTIAVLDGDSIFAWYLHEKGTLQIPTKVRLEYAFAEDAAFASAIEPVTDAKVQERYWTTKEKYLIKASDHRFKEFERVKDEVKKGHPDATTDEALKAAYEAEKHKYLIKEGDKEYKPLDEVKEEIRKDLTSSAEREKGVAKLVDLNDEIRKLRYESDTPKIDLMDLSSRVGLKYGKTPLFSTNDLGPVTSLLGSGQQMAKEMQSVAGYAVDTVLSRIDTDKGAFVAKIVEKQEGFTPPLTEPIAQHLLPNLKRETACKLAFHAARDLYNEARTRIANAIEEWAKAHKDAKAEEADKAKQNLRRDVFERLVAEKGLSLDEATVNRGGLNAGDFFDLPRYEIELVPKGSTTPRDVEPQNYEQTYWVTQPIEHIQPDGKDYDTEKVKIRRELERSAQADFFEKWIEAVWEKANVKDELNTKPAPGQTPPGNAPR